MSSNPLVFLLIGLACMFAPAILLTQTPLFSDAGAVPSTISTANAPKQACLDNSVRIAGGGRIGCVHRQAKAGPARRVDTSGAVFVSVGN